ncbi:transglutaminase [Thalassospira sp. MCCC 1A01148]|uniref:Transglutaminase n=2 Tax=Thalassospiraceae TaxID=2844866 RepID=A0A367VK89_9PROT|nr:MULTISPECIES: transglutaminase family protein [Thalassospira]KZB70791.1 transglutaminase [Thalassospira sp. MCCC 1A01148]MBR9899511.1 transglutaminase family protein [Rhodospirillales bacterium]RCK25576.1 transglutaminase [Thalassospira profundimaris]
MRLSIGCHFEYELQQITPMIALLNVHHSRVDDLEGEDRLQTVPEVAQTPYVDGFGNVCTRLIAPVGTFVLKSDGMIFDDGSEDEQCRDAEQHAVEDLPSEVLVYLLGSRYCETDLLSNEAWRLFENTPPGSDRVQAICDFVHGHIAFGYLDARATRTASEALYEQRGVCRDFTHLAIALCRCMNIPARYCTGYLSDIGEPLPHPSGDFAAWMEVYLSGRWWVFDPRNNSPRIGRVLIARGRDAADVPLLQTFGESTLRDFRVWTEEI